MKLSGLAMVALQSLYKASDQKGDLVAILQRTNAVVSVEQAQAAGRELEKLGFIDYTESRAYADAELTQKGISYVQANK